MSYVSQAVMENFKEIIIRVISASPYADGVEVTILTMGQKGAGPLGGNTAENIVLGDVIRPHRKHCYAVNFMVKAFAKFVFLTDEL